MAKPLIRDIIVQKKQVLKEPVKKIHGDAWDKAISDGIKEEVKEKKKIKKWKLPHFKFPRFRTGFPHLTRSKSKFKFVVGFAVLGILAALSVILLNRFSLVTVEITPRQEFVDVDTVFSASINPQKDELPLEMMRLNSQEQRGASATGVKQVSRRATGQVIIYNAYTSQPQNLVATTRLETPDGKIYRLDKAVTVPGAKIEGGEITASEIEVTVYADKAGEEYNIGLTDFTIPGFKDATKREKIYGRSKTEMKGGFIGEVAVVTEKDINDLDLLLKEKVQDYLLKTAVNPKPEEFLLYDNARQIVFNEPENMPKAGEETNLFKIEESATLFGFLLKKSDIDEALGKEYFNPETSREVEVVNASDLDFELKKFTETSITFGLKGQAHFAWEIDETSLKNDLIEERKNPDSVFLRYPAIEKAKIMFSPSWWRYIREDPSRIVVKRVLEPNP